MEHSWSDIDLAFGVRDAAAVADVLAGWTARMNLTHDAAHHYAVQIGAWIYALHARSSLKRGKV